MSYSSSGAVATLWSPTNYSGTTKMPVPRWYSSTSGTTSYRSTGNTERTYLGTTTGSYSSASRNLQTEYRSRYTPPIRSSTSVPTSYSRLSELHETSSRLASKERSDTNDSSLLGYSRSKTDNDLSTPLERCGLKSDSYKLRSDTVPRLLNTTKLDLKYSLNRKLGGGTSIDLSRYNSSSVKSSKVTDLNSRLQRKDSLTKSENIETSPSPIRSLERKSSSSATGGSSSPIEIRKSSEVWNKRLSGSYDSTIKGCFESDFFRKIVNENPGKLASRENSEDLSESSIFLENVETEEKTLSFAEIRRKFDNNDLNDGKVGFDNSTQKSSHSKDLKSSASNGVLLGVQYPYLDRNSKCKKLVDNSVEDADLDTIEGDQLDSSNSFPSSQTFHRLLLKRNSSTLKSNNNNNPNSGSNNNNPAYSNPRKSPDPLPDVTNNIKKKSLPDLKKAVLSPEKKELSPSNPMKIADITTPETVQNGESIIDNMMANESKRESRKAFISSALGLDNKAEIKIQPKRKGEKLATRVEQTLSKSDPEGKPREAENEAKVIELRRIEPNLMSPFEANNKVKELENKEKKISGSIGIGVKSADKSPQKPGKVTEKHLRTSPVKEVIKIGNQKELESGTNSVTTRKEAIVTNLVKTKKNASLKEEKESNNARERILNKRLMSDDSMELKPGKKSEDKVENDAAAKENPLLDKSDVSKNVNNRTLPGPSAYQSSNSFSSNENLENAGIHGTSPRLNVSYGRNAGIEKGGLNGLRNIGNTCFMNSVIQCLSNTKPLLEYLLNEDYLADINTTISGMKGALIKAFSNVIQELWAPNAEDKIINTINFKAQVQRFAPRFMGYSQQDAQEFLRYLLEGLHEDVNRVTVKPKPITTDIDDTLSDNQKATEAWKRYLRMDDSKVVDIFVGQLKSTLQCTVCGHCSVTFDPFWDLSLPVPNRNGQLRLSSCLEAFTKEEVLDGDEKPTCSKCKTRRKCTKSFSIQKFPKILVLHLKRFSPTERYRGKLSVTVEFPLTNLDLSPYAANRGQACAYNLYAISNHSGTAYSGHYTAYCKHPYTGNWHEYNDSGVSSLSSRSVVSGEAYVLFYELAAQTSHL